MKPSKHMPLGIGLGIGLKITGYKNVQEIINLFSHSIEYNTADNKIIKGIDCRNAST